MSRLFGFFPICENSMDTAVFAKKLKGSITPPPFKSEVIRTLILSGLCSVHPSDVLKNDERLGDDILSAESAVAAAFFEPQRGSKPIYVGASAALIRMLAPLLLFLHKSAFFSCEQQLLHRDMSELGAVLGCSVELDNAERTIRFSGGCFDKDRYTVSAKTSSQFASGMLIAAAVFGFAVRIPSPVSAPYIELTLDCLRSFGCNIEADEDGFIRIFGNLVPPPQFDFAPDMSYASNFICADMLSHSSGDIIIEGLDRVNNRIDADSALVFSLNELSIDDSPDLFPLICIHALSKQQDTVIHGISRLSGKESNRVLSTQALINALGGSIHAHENTVIVHGAGGRLHGGTVEGFGDHRIVMAAAIASLMCDDTVIIQGAEAVSKSAPCFFDDFRRLGGFAHEFIRK